MITNKDILVKIFQLLDVESLTQVEKVCRSWNEIVSDNDRNLWRSHFLDIKPFPADPHSGSKLRWKSKYLDGSCNLKKRQLMRYLKTGLVEQLAPFESMNDSVQPPTLDFRQMTYKNCYAIYWIVTRCRLKWQTHSRLVRLTPPSTLCLSHVL